MIDFRKMQNINTYLRIPLKASPCTHAKAGIVEMMYIIFENRISPFGRKDR